MKITKKINILLDLLYKYRFVLALVLFVTCLIFKINGSSIGCWDSFINLDKTDFMIGKNRFVRSDEWATLTPMFFSQIENGFHYFNDSLRATPTDVFMIYALPVNCIFQIFRPFLIGFMIFGAERGLSFFWCGRFITLFLVSLDFFLILTKKNKVLSFIGAFMITLSPLVQWWFAVNGIAELFIFGELIIIMIYKYLNTNSFKKRILYLIILFISMGGYALILYPSWQIPMAYVYFFIVIWVILDNYKKEIIKKRDIVSILATILTLVFMFLLILKKSSDTIRIVSNTDYPGSRFELGGGQLNYIFSYITNVFFPFKNSNILVNASEDSLMFSLFPIGLLLSIRELLLNKKKDKLIILILIVYLFICIWCIFGFPKLLAKLSLLSNSQSHRSLLALGFLDIILLMRSLSISTKTIPRIIALLYSIFFTGIVVLKSMILQKAYLNNLMIFCLIIMCIYLFYTALRFNSKNGKYLFSLGIISILIISGILVNPVRFGASSLLNNDIINNIKRIDSIETGIWITEGEGYPINNFIEISGVKTINSTNTYPDLEKWYLLDKEKKYKTIYNRYAQITMNIEKEYQEKFELSNPDLFIVNLELDDLDILNVKYIFTRNSLELFNDKNHMFKKIYEYNDFKIYRIFINN